MEINPNSGQIEIISPYGRVYLYTHDDSKTLLTTTHDILSKRERWDDPDYLSRMLFCEMIPEEFWKSNSGYGIGTQLYADIDLLISLDTVNQKITISSGLHSYSNLIFTFEEFVEDFLKGAKL